MCRNNTISWKPRLALADVGRVSSGWAKGRVCKGTPSSHSKNSLSKICSKGWVAQKHCLIGNYRSGVIFSKGWVRKDENLITWIGCRVCKGRGWTFVITGNINSQNHHHGNSKSSSGTSCVFQTLYTIARILNPTLR